MGIEAPIMSTPDPCGVALSCTASEDLPVEAVLTYLPLSWILKDNIALWERKAQRAILMYFLLKIRGTKKVLWGCFEMSTVTMFPAFPAYRNYKSCSWDHR